MKKTRNQIGINRNKNKKQINFIKTWQNNKIIVIPSEDYQKEQRAVLETSNNPNVNIKIYDFSSPISNSRLWKFPERLIIIQVKSSRNSIQSGPDFDFSIILKDLRFTQVRREQQRLKRQFLRKQQMKDNDKNYRLSGQKSQIKTQNDIQRELNYSKKSGRIDSKTRNGSQENLTFYAMINQEISPFTFRKKKSSFFSDSLNMTHRKNVQLLKEQVGCPNSIDYCKINLESQLGFMYSYHVVKTPNFYQQDLIFVNR